MRNTRAATAAAAVDLKLRCGSCRACMNTMGVRPTWLRPARVCAPTPFLSCTHWTVAQGQRRYDCLTQRMRAAALSGHAGAQVAVNGEGAVGAAIEVWWSGDQRFYPGMVAKYDHVSQEHAVIYQVSRDEAVRALSRNVKLQSSR